MTHSISAVINYCTNDYRFLNFCIQGVKPFCEKIIIPVCTHFFSGEPEDEGLLKRSYADHPDCHFVEFAYDEQALYGLSKSVVPGTETWVRHWHNAARYVGWHFAPSDYILYLDVDEICEGARMVKFLNGFDYREFEALHFSAYQYFREPCFRSRTNVNMPLLLKRDALSPELLFNNHERPGIFFHFQGRKKKSQRGLDNRPLFHHYSWVRTKGEILKKVSTWGHRYDREWKSLIEEEFSHDFLGTEKIHEFRYRTVKPPHPILDVVPTPCTTTPTHHVTRVDPKSIFKMNLATLLNA